MSRKAIMSYTLCIGIAVMAIVYAAFSTTLNVSGTTSQIGTFGVQLTGGSCTAVAGLTGATAPTVSITPSGSNKSASATVTASLNQPGDYVICYFDVVNTGNLKAKVSGSYSCTPSDVMATKYADTSSSKPMYYAISWNNSSLAGGQTVQKAIEFTINYSSKITSQPTTTSGTVTCTFPYTQDI